jgi:hypothetical protein
LALNPFLVVVLTVFLAFHPDLYPGLYLDHDHGLYLGLYPDLYPGLYPGLDHFFDPYYLYFPVEIRPGKIVGYSFSLHH